MTKIVKGKDPRYSVVEEQDGGKMKMQDGGGPKGYLQILAQIPCRRVSLLLLRAEVRSKSGSYQETALGLQ